MTLPSRAEVEHADWPALQSMCEALGLNPKGRSAVVRMRVADYIRHRVHAESWRPGREHQAALLTHIGFPQLAERLWESTIRMDAPAPWVGLGHAELAAGRLAEAAKSFGRAIQMGDAAAELHRAEALAAAGDFPQAAQACDTYLEARPGDLRALAMKAGFLFRAGFRSEATATWQSAAKAHPEVPDLIGTLGIALLKEGRHANADDAFQEGIRRNEKDVALWTNRGVALLLEGRTREAMGALRRALELEPGRAETLNDLGVAYVRTGHKRSAVVNLERAAKHLGSPRIQLNVMKIRETARGADEAGPAEAESRTSQREGSKDTTDPPHLADPSKTRRPTSTSPLPPGPGQPATETVRPSSRHDSSRRRPRKKPHRPSRS